MRRLLDEGMDVNAVAQGPKSKGVTPLHLAAEGGHLELMDELLERGADIDARTKGACGCKYINTISHCYFLSFAWKRSFSILVFLLLMEIRGMHHNFLIS